MGYLGIICLLLISIIAAFIEVYCSLMDAMLFVGACSFAFFAASYYPY